MGAFYIGTQMVHLSYVKLRLSHRDLLLLLGILVAVIIGVSMFVYQTNPGVTKRKAIPGKSELKTVPAVVIKKLLERVRI